MDIKEKKITYKKRIERVDRIKMINLFVFLQLFTLYYIIILCSFINL